MMRAALVQLTVSDDPVANLPVSVAASNRLKVAAEAGVKALINDTTRSPPKVSVSPSGRVMNGFGYSRRDTGQRRVPAPPERITGISMQPCLDRFRNEP